MHTITDSKVHQFLRIAGNIRAKQAPIKTTPKRIIAQWVVLGVLTLLLAPFMEYLHPFLAAYGLGWVLFLAMAGVGALGIFLVVVTLVNNRSNQAYEANLNEIWTLLKFNTIMKIMPEAKLALKKNS